MCFGLSLLAVILFFALLAPFLYSHQVLEMELSRSLEGPSLHHFFGLDENGSDLFSQVLYGSRTSLWVAIVVVGVSLLIGLFIGSLSAWLPSIVDQILMRLVDAISAFPRFLLALALLAVMGANLHNLILALCLSGWTSFARLVRAEILHLKKKEYVLAGISYGASGPRLLLHHIWPNLLGILLVQIVFSLIAVVIAEAGLSFLGLGVPAEVPSWGRLLSSGRQVIAEAPHLIFFPALALFTLVLGFQLFGEALSEFFNPQRRRLS